MDKSYSDQISLARGRANRLRIICFTAVLAVMAVPGISYALNRSSTDTPLTATFVKAATTNTPVVGGPSATKTALPATAMKSTKLVAVPSCHPAGRTIAPTKVTLNSYQSGLVLLPTQVHNYTVYGNSTSQINQQIFSCSPVELGGKRYGGSTEYAIDWSYAFDINDLGQCVVSSSSVGLSVSMTLPSWQPSANASPTLKRSWNDFIANLSTHENGHAKLAKNYATKILADIQNQPAADCEQIDQIVSAKIKAEMTALARANDDYDTHTKHGATQGASLR